MKRATLLVAMMLLLGSASVALAHDTAWVLWGHWIGKVSVWTVLAGYPTYQECTAERSMRFMDRVARAKKDTSKKNLGFDVKTAQYWWDEVANNAHETISLVCLPDTLDPREKKE